MKAHELLIPSVHTYYRNLQKLSAAVFILFATLFGISLAINEFNQATAQNQGTYAY